MSSSQGIKLSQNPSDRNTMEAPDSPPDTSLVTASGQAYSQPANGSRVNGESAKVNHGAAGSSWSSKKFHDEYERAASSLVDQQWDNTKYGDPLIQS